MHSFYAERPRGLMDDSLLNQYIESVIVPRYPNMSDCSTLPEHEQDCDFYPRTGKLNQGPVILKLDAGPGRIVSNEVILKKR